MGTTSINIDEHLSTSAMISHEPNATWREAGWCRWKCMVGRHRVQRGCGRVQRSHLETGKHGLQIARGIGIIGSLNISFSTNYSKNKKMVIPTIMMLAINHDKPTNYRDDRVWTTIKETMLHPSQSSWCSWHPDTDSIESDGAQDHIGEMIKPSFCI